MILDILGNLFQTIASTTVSNVPWKEVVVTSRIVSEKFSCMSISFESFFLHKLSSLRNRPFPDSRFFSFSRLIPFHERLQNFHDSNCAMYEKSLMNAIWSPLFCSWGWGSALVDSLLWPGKKLILTMISSVNNFSWIKHHCFSFLSSWLQDTSLIYKTVRKC